MTNPQAILLGFLRKLESHAKRGSAHIMQPRIHWNAPVNCKPKKVWSFHGYRDPAKVRSTVRHELLNDPWWPPMKNNWRWVMMTSLLNPIANLHRILKEGCNLHRILKKCIGSEERADQDYSHGSQSSYVRGLIWKIQSLHHGSLVIVRQQGSQVTKVSPSIQWP